MAFCTLAQSDSSQRRNPQKIMPGSPLPENSSSRLTGRQWLVLGLLFFAVAINHIDRAVIGVLKPLLDVELGWNQKDYGWMVTAFQAAYASGYLLAGRWVDRVGVRTGLLLAVTVWSGAAMSHALACTVLGFSLARSGWPRAAVSPRRSRRWRNGFRGSSGRLRRDCSMRAVRWARSPVR